MKATVTSPIEPRSQFRRRQLFLGAALAGLSLPAMLADGGQFPTETDWNFVFINHQTTDPYFKPTIQGIEDACAALNCTYQWQGSSKLDPFEMNDVFKAAIDNNVAGIAVSLINPDLTPRVDDAINKGIPVIAYNVDIPSSNRLAYIGQDLEESGYQVGQSILALVPKEGHIVGFIRTSIDRNTKLRMDGVQRAMDEAKQLGHFSGKFETVLMGDVNMDEFIREYAKVNTDIKGMITVDGSSTAALASIMQYLHENGVHAGGYDLLRLTSDAIHNGFLDFSIDQRPYTQGFMSVLQLFLYKLSDGLVYPCNIDTGIHFVTQKNVDPYLTSSRFNGE